MININKKELRKISHDFRSMGSRVINAHYQEGASLIAMFLKFIDTTPLIKDYICSLPEVPEKTIEIDLKTASEKYGRAILSTGDTPEDEIAYIYSLLHYSVKNPNLIINIGKSYSHSNRFQDMVRAFGNHIVLPFTNNINRYLTHLGIDMGIDESEHFEITVNGGQFNLAKDNSTINATQNNGIDVAELNQLVDKVLNLLSQAELSSAKFESIKDNVTVLHEELKNNPPRKGFVKTAISGLQGSLPYIKDAIELSATITTLIQFAMTAL